MATIAAHHSADWVQAYADELYGYLMLRLRDEATAKDLLQDSMLAAWKNRHTLLPDQPVRAWLYTIVRRKLIDHYRKQAARLKAIAPMEESSAPFFDEQAHWAAGFYPKDWGEAADGRTQSREFYQILGGCRKKLKAMQDMVFTMKYLEDMDSPDICKELGITTSHYWVLVHRAKVQLRACLEQHWFLAST